MTAGTTRSPWWYRQRALTIGAVYFLAFFMGSLISSATNLPVAPVAVVLGRAHGPHGYRAYFVLAVLLAIVCWALRTWGGAYLKPSTVWNADALDDRLIVAGPFRFVRNPLYLGNIVLAVAMSAYASALGAAIVIAGNVVVSYMLISVEESLMSERYGASFAAYRAAVPALFPRLLPWKDAPPSPTAPSLALGLRSELFSAAFVASTIFVAVRFW